MRSQVNMQSGFTLIEIVIAVSLTVMILTLVVYFGVDISKYSLFVGDSIAGQYEIQTTFKLIATEIRSIGPADTGAYPIESADSNSLIFYSDIDQDGHFERERYFLSNGILYKGIVKPAGSPLSYNLANEKISEVVHDVISGPDPIFLYYGKNSGVGGIPLSFPISPSGIRMIKISLISDKDPNSSPGPVNYTIYVNIRNLRNDNL